MSCLNIEKVSCHYNGRPVLEQLSLQVADNEIVCPLRGGQRLAWRFNPRGAASCLA